MTTSGLNLLVGVTYEVPRLGRDVLTAIRTRIGDPRANIDPPHITFIPPTPIASADLVDFAVHVDEVAAVTLPFRVGLEGAGTFRPVTNVVFARLATGVAECAALAEVLRSGPVEVALERPYHPHVTVAHNLSHRALDRAEAELDGFAATFLVNEIVMSIRHAADEDGAWTPFVQAELGAPARLGQT